MLMMIKMSKDELRLTSDNNLSLKLYSTQSLHSYWLLLLLLMTVVVVVIVVQ